MVSQRFVKFATKPNSAVTFYEFGMMVVLVWLDGERNWHDQEEKNRQKYKKTKREREREREREWNRMN